MDREKIQSIIEKYKEIDNLYEMQKELKEARKKVQVGQRGQLYIGGSNVANIPKDSWILEVIDLLDTLCETELEEKILEIEK